MILDGNGKELKLSNTNKRKWILNLTRFSSSPVNSHLNLLVKRELELALERKPMTKINIFKYCSFSNIYLEFTGILISYCLNTKKTLAKVQIFCGTDPCNNSFIVWLIFLSHYTMILSRDNFLLLWVCLTACNIVKSYTCITLIYMAIYCNYATEKIITPKRFEILLPLRTAIGTLLLVFLLTMKGLC